MTGPPGGRPAAATGGSAADEAAGAPGPHGVLGARSSRVRRARQLALGKQRRALGEFLAEGPQAVSEALTAGVALELFVSESATQRSRGQVQRALAAGIPVRVLDAGAFSGLASAQTPQGVVARCRWDPPDLQMVLDQPGPGQIALAHEMSDPGNAGALIRVADAAGARAVALSQRCVDPTNPKCVRATAGSLFHLPVVDAGSTPAALGLLRAAGYRVLAAEVSPRAVDLFDAEAAGLLAGRVAWVFGNEAHGLPDDVLAGVDGLVRVPILGRAESLNLATAAAVCLYAVARVALAARSREGSDPGRVGAGDSTRALGRHARR